MAEVNEINVCVFEGKYKDKTIKRSPPIKNLTRIIGYIIFKARVAFIKLRKAFNKAQILQYFDLEYYIQIKTNALGYAISRVLSHLTSDNSGQ